MNKFSLVLIAATVAFLAYVYVDAYNDHVQDVAIRAEIAKLDASPVAVVEDAPAVYVVDTAKRAAAIAKFEASETVAYVAPRYSREAGGFMGHGNRGMMEP